jgi:hypothetical protein
MRPSIKKTSITSATAPEGRRLDIWSIIEEWCRPVTAQGLAQAVGARKSRGPYCAFAPDAVRTLRVQGYAARYLSDGLPEWAAAGGRTMGGSDG